MELSRGICILCMDNSKVVFPPQAEDITHLLCDILEHHVDVNKFEETAKTLKVCPLCLAGILKVAELKKNSFGFSESVNSCSICQNGEHLVFISNWPHFSTLLQNIGVDKKIKRCTFCVQCINNLEVFERIKTNFFKRYPRLELREAAKEKSKRENKNHISPKQLSSASISSDCESDNEHFPNINNLNSALKHLTPLENSNYNIDQYKHDKKLSKQIAFVKLGISKQTGKNRSKYGLKKSTKSFKSFFKIRLKLNANKAKAHRIEDGKVVKPTSKPKTSLLDKELVVKILKMNLKNTYSDLYENQPLMKTPTKASLKLMPEDPLFSNKKRKSVTFANKLDVEIVDGANSKKNNMDGSPLKSSLKKADAAKEIDNESIDSGEEENASHGYVEEIRKNNDSIFDNLKETDRNTKKLGENNSNDYESNPKSQKREISHIYPEDVDDDDDNCDIENTTTKRMRRDSDENGRNSASNDNPLRTTNVHLNICDNVNDSDNQQQMEKESDDNKNEADKEFENSGNVPDNKNSGKGLKLKKLFSCLDNMSVSSESSKEDVIVTLEDYKKIKKTRESLVNLDLPFLEDDKTNNDTANSLDSEKTNIIIKDTIKSGRNNYSANTIEEENGDVSPEENTDSNLMKTGKASDNFIEKDDNMLNDKVGNNSLQVLKNLVSDDNEHCAVSNEPNINSDIIALDTETTKLHSEETEKEATEFSKDLSNLNVTETSYKTDKEMNISSNVSTTDALSSVIQNGSDVIFNKLDVPTSEHAADCPVK